MNCKLTSFVGDVDGPIVGFAEGDFDGDIVGELVVGLALGDAVMGLIDGAGVMGESVGDPVSTAAVQANNAESPTSTSGSGSKRSGRIPLLFPLSVAASSGMAGASAADASAILFVAATSEDPLLRVDKPTDKPIINRNEAVAAMNHPILFLPLSFDDGYW